MVGDVRFPGNLPCALLERGRSFRDDMVSSDTWEALLPSILGQAGVAETDGMTVRPLAGGVSSDIVRVTLADGREYCAKRALTKLKVAGDWQAPTERNHFEVAWFRRANSIVPQSAPDVLAEDHERGISLLTYLSPDQYVLWKDELLAGRCDPQVPRSVADTIGRIHRATLMDSATARDFPTDALFDALRIDPYLRTVAVRHPAIANQILGCIDVMRSSKIALVHVDLSPKNILISRDDAHPVILDAECAWYGDPAFDSAFCLNHLVLKSIHMPSLAEPLPAQAREFFALWLVHFPPNIRGELEKRTAALLPCLMLARVDGKSPVEYLIPARQQLVRDLAIPLITEAPRSMAAIYDAVAGALEPGGQGPD